MLALRLTRGARPAVQLRRLLVAAASAGTGFLLLCALGHALSHPDATGSSLLRLAWCMVPLAATVHFAVAVARTDPGTKPRQGLSAIGLGPARQMAVSATTTALSTLLGSMLALLFFLHLRGDLTGLPFDGDAADTLAADQPLPLPAALTLLSLLPVIASLSVAVTLRPREPRRPDAPRFFGRFGAYGKSAAARETFGAYGRFGARWPGSRRPTRPAEGRAGGATAAARDGDTLSARAGDTASARLGDIPSVQTDGTSSARAGDTASARLGDSPSVQTDATLSARVADTPPAQDDGTSSARVATTASAQAADTHPTPTPAHSPDAARPPAPGSAPAALPWGVATLAAGLAVEAYATRATASPGLALPGGLVGNSLGVLVGWTLTAVGLALAGPGLTYLCGRLLQAVRPGALRLLAGRILMEEAVRIGRPLGVVCAVTSAAYAMGTLYDPDGATIGPLTTLGSLLVAGCTLATLLTAAVEAKHARADTTAALLRLGAPSTTLRAAAALRAGALLALFGPLTLIVAELAAQPLTR
ncbi:hypothetical protein ACIQ6Y_36745 [Streptomyces sp. NPDC096205]|uniref:hypothetical protein n=1 Tax=Streptomyces sp. NPDC096205 TaxID=3366081 RepID=UPI00382A15F9